MLCTWWWLVSWCYELSLTNHHCELLKIVSVRAGPGRCEEGGFLSGRGARGSVSPWKGVGATPLLGGEDPQTLQNSSICKINVWPLLAYKFLVLLFVWDSVVNLMHTRFTWRKRSCLQTVVNLIYNYTLTQKKGSKGGRGGGGGPRTPGNPIRSALAQLALRLLI